MTEWRVSSECVRRVLASLRRSSLSDTAVVSWFATLSPARLAAILGHIGGLPDEKQPDALVAYYAEDHPWMAA